MEIYLILFLVANIFMFFINSKFQKWNTDLRHENEKTLDRIIAEKQKLIEDSILLGKKIDEAINTQKSNAKYVDTELMKILVSYQELRDSMEEYLTFLHPDMDKSLIFRVNDNITIINKHIENLKKNNNYPPKSLKNKYFIEKYEYSKN